METHTQIAAGVLLAVFLAVAAGGYIATQPRPAAAPAPAYTPAARPSPTPRALYAAPGRKIRQAPECYLATGARWRPLKYEAISGEVWVLVDAGAGCLGWMIDPS